MPIINQSAYNTSQSASSGQSSWGDRLQSLYDKSLLDYSRYSSPVLQVVKKDLSASDKQTIENSIMIAAIDQICANRQQQGSLSVSDEPSSYTYSSSVSAAAAATSSLSEPFTESSSFSDNRFASVASTESSSNQKDLVAKIRDRYKKTPYNLLPGILKVFQQIPVSEQTEENKVEITVLQEMISFAGLDSVDKNSPSVVASSVSAAATSSSNEDELMKPYLLSYSCVDSHLLPGILKAVSSIPDVERTDKQKAEIKVLQQLISSAPQKQSLQQPGLTETAGASMTNVSGTGNNVETNLYASSVGSSGGSSVAGAGMTFVSGYGNTVKTNLYTWQSK